MPDRVARHHPGLGFCRWYRRAPFHTLLPAAPHQIMTTSPIGDRHPATHAYQRQAPATSARVLPSRPDTPPAQLPRRLSQALRAARHELGAAEWHPATTDTRIAATVCHALRPPHQHTPVLRERIQRLLIAPLVLQIAAQQISRTVAVLLRVTADEIHVSHELTTLGPHDLDRSVTTNELCTTFRPAGPTLLAAEQWLAITLGLVQTIADNEPPQTRHRRSRIRN
jgi:hypothetical protein